MAHRNLNYNTFQDDPQPSSQSGPLQNTDQAHAGPNPSQDEEDGANSAPPAPPPGVNGEYPEGDYASVNFNDSGPVPPPANQELMQETERPPEQFAISTLNEEEVQDALLQFVSEKCCYGSNPAKEMTITQILPSSALHYQVETFCESRITKGAFEPYLGNAVDGPMFGKPPPVWTIECYPNNMFLDHTKHMRVPHTEHVSECHACSARGFKRCNGCNGSGDNICGGCGGQGRIIDGHNSSGPTYRPCPYGCSNGRNRCTSCHGDGKITCKTCNGFRALLNFIKLSIEFKNHTNDYILERSDLPNELVRDVKGKKIFSQEGVSVWPISSHPVPEICRQSKNIINSHKQKYRSEKQLRQKHWLRSVPVSEVHYKYKDFASRFWVYGFEKKVYAPDYPDQCCCGCNIL